jgi:NAD(P)-dependent dehydrogenase (short-subunit alcohol dehydrogenase family)
MENQEKTQAREIKDSCVLITGGTSGVGLAAAMQFAEAGAKGIAINGRNTERGEKARQSILDKYPDAKVFFVAGDCNIAAQATRVCEQAREKMGSVDVLVNSTVSPYGPKLLKDIAVDEMENIIVQQMMAQLLTSRIVYPWMSENGGGVITNIASDAGKVTTPGETVLGAAMAGIIMFSRTMAMEAKRNGVRVNVLTPSIIEGTLTNLSVMDDPFGSKLFGKAIKMASLGVCVPDDLANMILFLASPQASRLTGQAISINGGISAA